MLEDRSGGAVVGSDVAVLLDSSPESLDALIAARLDTLDIEEKSLLQDASVIGRVFWATAVAEVSGSDVQSVQVGLGTWPSASSSGAPGSPPCRATLSTHSRTP